jgi:hypothetical protein
MGFQKINVRSRSEKVDSLGDFLRQLHLIFRKKFGEIESLQESNLFSLEFLLKLILDLKKLME